jgi:aminopeptidase N
MHRFAYKNATSEDLLAVMSEVSGKDLVSVFTPWIK